MKIFHCLFPYFRRRRRISEERIIQRNICKNKIEAYFPEHDLELPFDRSFKPWKEYSESMCKLVLSSFFLSFLNVFY